MTKTHQLNSEKIEIFTIFLFKMGIVFRSSEHAVVNASTMVENLIHDPRVNGSNPTTGRWKEKNRIMLNDMEQRSTGLRLALLYILLLLQVSLRSKLG